MKTSASISVIIPCYNQASYLVFALNSVLAQTINDWECIVVNDGSTDDTMRVAEEYTKKCCNIRFIEQDNAGTSAARNLGLQEATGRYIQFIDADDFIAPDKFEKQLALLSHHSELSVSLCDYSYTYADGTIWPQHPCYKSPKINTDYPLWDLATRWEVELSIPIHCFLFDARAFKEYGLDFDQNLISNEDFDCWMRLFTLNPKVAYIDEILAFYRMHGNNKTSNIYNMRKSFFQVLMKQKKLLENDVKMQHILRRKEIITKRMYRKYFLPWSIFYKTKSKARLLMGLFGLTLSNNQ